LIIDLGTIASIEDVDGYTRDKVTGYPFLFVEPAQVLPDVVLDQDTWEREYRFRIFVRDEIEVDKEATSLRMSTVADDILDKLDSLDYISIGGIIERTDGGTFGSQRTQQGFTKTFELFFNIKQETTHA
jgi:hypothetical protein